MGAFSLLGQFVDMHKLDFSSSFFFFLSDFLIIYLKSQLDSSLLSVMLYSSFFFFWCIFVDCQYFLFRSVFLSVLVDSPFSFCSEYIRRFNLMIKKKLYIDILEVIVFCICMLYLYSN